MRGASVLVVVVLAAAVSACGSSSSKKATKAGGSAATTTSSQTTVSSSTAMTSGGVTSAPGSGNPYGPNSPTSPTGLGRILVKDGLVNAGQAKCTANGLLKELSPPEVQALANNRVSKDLKAHVAKAAKACAAGAPSGG